VNEALKQLTGAPLGRPGDQVDPHQERHRPPSQGEPFANPGFLSAHDVAELQPRKPRTVETRIEPPAPRRARRGQRN
jgi:hypothetical protein